MPLDPGVAWLLRRALLDLDVQRAARRSRLCRCTIVALKNGSVPSITCEVDEGLARLVGTPVGWWLWIADATRAGR